MRASKAANKVFVAGCAGVGEKVGPGLNGMRLASDQARQAATALATIRRQQLVHFFEFDLVHGAHAMLHASGVNSASVQPSIVLTGAFVQRCPFALARPFLALNHSEPFEPLAIYKSNTALA
jgi:hypothetical protein